MRWRTRYGTAAGRGIRVRPRDRMGDNPESRCRGLGPPGDARSDQQLVLGELAVERHRLDELLVGALADHAALVEHDDAVGVDDRRAGAR